MELMEVRKHALAHVPSWVVAGLCGGGNRNSEFAFDFPWIRRVPEDGVECFA